MATFEQLAAATETNTGFTPSIGEYQGAFNLRRFTFAAGAVLALVGCTSGDVTPVSDERVNVAANIDPNCNPEDIDFTKESADKNFDAADGVFPSMPGSASKKAEAVKTLQEAT